ncbi:MAG: hypothetical protein ACYDBV_14940 [Nitrospiria bacterium]
MKKLFLLPIVFIFLLSSFFPHAHALTPTGAPTKTADESVSQSLTDKIDRLKSVLASKVAELKLVDKKGIVGTVQDSSNTQITLLDLHGTARLVDIDEITKFSSSGNTTFGISDIKKGMKISVLGLYNKESQRILGRFINTLDSPLYLSGVITDVDKINYLVTLMQENGKAEKVDIENLTRTITYNDTLDPTRAGFSKASSGTRAVIVGYANTKEANRITASRILLFPTLPNDPKIHFMISNTFTPTIQPTAELKRIVTP